MKKLIFTIAILLVGATFANAQTLQKFFEKYADDERFQYVSVGKGMSNLASSLGGLASDDKKMMQKMQGMKILTLDADLQSAFAKSVMSELDHIIEIGNFESVVETRDKGERVNIYTRVTGNNDSDMLIVTRERAEFSCIWIKGKMTKQEIIDSFSSNIQILDDVAMSF